MPRRNGNGRAPCPAPAPYVSPVLGLTLATDAQAELCLPARTEADYGEFPECRRRHSCDVIDCLPCRGIHPAVRHRIERLEVQELVATPVLIQQIQEIENVERDFCARPLDG